MAVSAKKRLRCLKKSQKIFKNLSEKTVKMAVSPLKKAFAKL